MRRIAATPHVVLLDFGPVNEQGISLETRILQNMPGHCAGTLPGMPLTMTEMNARKSSWCQP
jgi:hypothetical protein